MKRILTTGLVIMIAIAGYAQSEIAGLEYAPSQFIYSYQNDIEATGTMMLKDGTWIIRVTTRTGDVDYVPTNLDLNFKTEGLLVHFKAELEDIPDNVRMIGQPVKLITIERVQ